MKTKLIIDTSTITSSKGLPEFVTVVPLAIIENNAGVETVYDDVETISIDNIKNGLRENKTYKTSQPNLAYIYDAIEKDYQKYNRIIINPIASGISSTYSTILGILKEVDKDNKVLLLDSKHCSYRGWMYNQTLFQMIKDNKSNDEILAFTKEFESKHGLFFFLTNIDFLIKGGRVSNFKGFIAKKIGLIISIFWIDGGLKSLGKDKSMTKLFDKSIKLELGHKKKQIEDIFKVTYYYNKNEDEAKFSSFLKEIKSKYPHIKMEYVDYSLPSAIYVHTGDGGIYFDIYFK
ncbi:MAG: DegV family protein [Mycoplasmoidaceae bacterium]